MYTAVVQDFTRGEIHVEKNNSNNAETSGLPDKKTGLLNTATMHWKETNECCYR